MDTLKFIINHSLLSEPVKQLDYIPLIVGLITFIGVVINSIYLYKIQKNTRIDKYYDKILDKRLHAYELLENILQSLFVKDKLTMPSGEIKPVHKLFTNYESFTNFKNDFLEMATNTIWFSEKLVIEISNLNNKLFDIENTFNHNDKWSYLIVGSQNHDRLVNIYINLRKLHIEDLKELYKVKEFLNKHSQLISSIKPLNSN